MQHPFLIGDIIYLRAIEREDLNNNYFQWLNDKEVTRWMQNGVFPNSIKAMEDYYNSHLNNPKELVLAIISKVDDIHIGNIGLHRIHPIFHSAEIGILIGEKDYWGKGVASEAVSILVRHAFMRLNLHRLYAGATVNNVGSIRAFEKAQFRREGIAREAYYCEGEYLDCVHLSLLRTEWQNKSNRGETL